MSRFGRNYLEVGFYTEILFPKKQIRFIAINNSVDSDKPQDNDFTQFLNIRKECTKRNAYCPVLCIAPIAAVRCPIRRITTKAENPITRSDAAATGTEP